jgi:hypothetical protein
VPRLLTVRRVQQAPVPHPAPVPNDLTNYKTGMFFHCHSFGVTTIQSGRT